MPVRVGSIEEVAARQLCSGCGACAYISPGIEMIDVLDHGRRPRLRPGAAADPRTAEALEVCPGLDQSHTFDGGDPALVRELLGTWGPVREMWEGHATDPEIRFGGSSGGAATALALFGIEQAGMHGVLHIAQREDAPYLNRTVLSTTRAELVARTGSRYAPASPGDGLQMIEDAPAPCVFVGKPCDAVAASKARRLRPRLDEKLGLVIAFFCAGTPTTAGTIEMLRRMGVSDLSTVRSLRYRGNGWPGRATVVVEAGGGVSEKSLTYEQSWGEVLSKHKQWRCNLCPDRTGEFADVAVGDPWYEGVPEDAPGRSLVLARTERGRDFVRRAAAAGYLTIVPAENWKLPASQTGFASLRGAIWGRLVTLRILGVRVPSYAGFSFFRHFVTELPLSDKVRSILGTARRVFRRRLRSRVAMTPFVPPRDDAEKPASMSRVGAP